MGRGWKRETQEGQQRGCKRNGNKRRDKQGEKKSEVERTEQVDRDRGTKRTGCKIAYGQNRHADSPHSPAPPNPLAGDRTHLLQTLSSEDRAREHFWPFIFTTKVSWGLSDQGQHCSKQTLKVQLPHFWVLPKDTTASS